VTVARELINQDKEV